MTSMLATFFAATLVIWSDAAKTKPLFVPAEAFSSPRKYGLSNDAIAAIDRDMLASREARMAIGDEATACAMQWPTPPDLPIKVSGTILEITAGWNTQQHAVTSLARIRITAVTAGDLHPGNEVLVELPSGAMSLGRTIWCTGSRANDAKRGDTIAFRASRRKSEPALLVAFP